MENKKKKSVKEIVFRTIVVIISMIFTGAGVGMLRLSCMGTDPFSSMNYGMAEVLGIRFSQWSIGFNIAALLLVILFARSYIGIGTICNMFLSSIFSDLFCDLVTKQFGESFGIPARIGFLIAGVLCVCFFVSYYMTADLGMGPYDALAYIISDHTNGKITFKWARIGTDVCCVIVGFIAGTYKGNVWDLIGIGTIVMAFFTGPLIAFFRKGAEAFISGSLKKICPQSESGLESEPENK